MAENPEDIMLEQAISNLDANNPTQLILGDILMDEVYNPNISESENFNNSVLGAIFKDTESQPLGTDTAINMPVSTNMGIPVSDNKPKVVSNTTGFDYSDYSNENYLNNVAGKTIEVANPVTGQIEKRQYSDKGHSYSVVVDDGGLKSHRVTTTHNIFTNEPNSNSFDSLPDFYKESRKLDQKYLPYAVGAVTAPISTAVLGGIDWLFGGDEQEE